MSASSKKIILCNTAPASRRQTPTWPHVTAAWVSSHIWGVVTQSCWWWVCPSLPQVLNWTPALAVVCTLCVQFTHIVLLPFSDNWVQITLQQLILNTQWGTKNKQCIIQTYAGVTQQFLWNDFCVLFSVLGLFVWQLKLLRWQVLQFWSWTDPQFWCEKWGFLWLFFEARWNFSYFLICFQ